MTDSKSHEFKIDSFDHIGHVVKDRDATMESWTKLFGVEWRKVVDSGVLKMATGTLGLADVELLEPTEDKSLWAAFLKTHGEGLHHICYRVANIDDAIAKLTAQGGEVMISTPGIFAYVNIGGPGSVILELLKTNANTKKAQTVQK